MTAIGPLGDPPGAQDKESLIIRLMQENGDLRSELRRLRMELETRKPPIIIPSTIHSINTLVNTGATKDIQNEAAAAVVRMLHTFT